MYFAASAASDEAEIDVVVLKPQETHEMPYPLQKEAGEGADGWMFQDGAGHILLSIVFVESAESFTEFESARATRAASLMQSRIFIRRMHDAIFSSSVEQEPTRFESEPTQFECEIDDPMLPGTPSAPTNMDGVVLECCICLDSKSVAQMATFVPCGHIVAVAVLHQAGARRHGRAPAE